MGGVGDGGGEGDAGDDAAELGKRDVGVRDVGGGIPGDASWRAMEEAAGRMAPRMIPQDLANIMWSYGTLERQPRRETWIALQKAGPSVHATRSLST